MKMSVKEYAELIGKNEKTVYKMIKGKNVTAAKEDGKFRITVDKNLIKVIERAQQALNEAKAILLSIEQASDQIKKPVKSTVQPKPVAKKSAPTKKAVVKKSTKPVKKSVKATAKPLKKSTKKVITKKPVAKKSTQKKK